MDQTEQMRLTYQSMIDDQRAQIEELDCRLESFSTVVHGLHNTRANLQAELAELNAVAAELRDLIFEDASAMTQGAMLGSPIECLAFAKWWIQRAKGLPTDTESSGAFSGTVAS